MDHYQLLGIQQTASKDEIKKAYHKLALKCHPDKNKASNAEEAFRALNEAYKILKDDQKREIYDRFDLPQVKRVSCSSASRSHHRTATHTDHRHNDRFFTGSSEAYSEEKHYRDKLDKIRRTNTELLDRANSAKLSEKRRQSNYCEQRKKATSNYFKGEILPEKNDDDYEKIVLERLRALGRQ